jgi:hypothetical protein
MIEFWSDVIADSLSRSVTTSKLVFTNAVGSTWTYNRLSGRVVLNQAVLLVNWLELLRILLAGSGEEGQDISCLLLPRTRGDQVLIDFLRVIVCRTCGPLLGP